MPAYFESGFCVRKPSWHRQEILLDEWPTTWDEARTIAGLTWDPIAVPVVELVDPLAELPLSAEGETTARVRVDYDRQRICRSDNGMTLAYVSDQFSIIDHGHMGQIFEALLGEGLKFETAGSTDEGRKVYGLAYLDEPYTLPGDDSEHFPFLAVLTAHDGTGACKALRTQVRVVCWNTWHAADADGNRHGLQFTFRHAGDVATRIEEAKAALSGLRDDRQQYIELANELMGMPADEVKLNHFLSEFIPEPEADIVSDRVRENINQARKIFRQIYLESPTTETIRGTAFGLVSSAGEYLDHVRGFRNADTYLGRTMLRPEPLKTKAMEIARRVCK